MSWLERCYQTYEYIRRAEPDLIGRQEPNQIGRASCRERV